MNRWNDRVRRLLYGRYGPDQLMWALLVLVGIFMLLRWLTGWRMWWIFSVLMLAICYLRVFSHDIMRRRAENEWFLRLWRPVARRISLAREAARNVKTHRHFHCPKCGQPLRVPRGRGRLEIRCPRCGYCFKRRT